MEARPVMFVDSNYWIYLFDKTTVEHEQVKKHFDTIYDQATLAVNATVLVEVMHYLIKRLGPVASKAKWEIFRSMDMLAGDLAVDDIDAVHAVLCEHAHAGIGGRDATILQFMASHHIDTICTHDRSFARIPGITVIDPVA